MPNSTPLSQLETEIEEGLIACILRAPEKCLDIIPLLSPDQFATPSLSLVVKTILEVHAGSEPVQWVVIASHLAKHVATGELDINFLKALQSDVSIRADYAREFFNLHVEAFTKRKVMEVSNKFIAEAAASNGNFQGLLEDFKTHLAGFKTPTNEEGIPINEVLTLAWNEIEEAASGTRKVIPTGIPKLDEALTRGLRYGESVVIGGRPGSGKTSFMLNVVNHNPSVPILFFSFETGPAQLGKMLMSVRGKISARYLLDGSIMKSLDRDRMVVITAELQETNLHVLPSPSTGMDFIEAQARKFFEQHGPGLMVIDTINRIYEKSRKFESRQKELSYVMNRIDLLAEKLGICLVTIAQLNRESEKRGGHPRISDLRDCGELEEIADNVFLLYDDESKAEGQSATANPSTVPVSLFIGKQRLGPAGFAVEMMFRKDAFSFFPKETYYA